MQRLTEVLPDIEASPVVTPVVVASPVDEPELELDVEGVAVSPVDPPLSLESPGPPLDPSFGFPQLRRRRTGSTRRMAVTVHASPRFSESEAPQRPRPDT